MQNLGLLTSHPLDPFQLNIWRLALCKCTSLGPKLPYGGYILMEGVDLKLLQNELFKYVWDSCSQEGQSTRKVRWA